MNFGDNQAYIPTKKTRTKYTFVGGQQDYDVREPKDDGSSSEYFQVCAFKDPTTKRYHMRKFAINGKNEFSSIKDFYLKKKECKKFMNVRKSHEYKVFPQYNLNNVQPPTLQEVCTSKSSILGNDYGYTGYAPF